MMFEWLRNKVKNAILAGVNDAMEALAGQAENVPQDAGKELEDRVRLLPSPKNGVDSRRRS